MLELIKLCDAFCDKPGLYEVPYPIDKPTGHLLIYLPINGPACMTFVPDPVAMFSDSEEAFTEPKDLLPVLKLAGDNIIKFKRTHDII